MVAALDVATGSSEKLAALRTTGAVVAGGAIYYQREDGLQIRRLAGATDDVVATVPDGMSLLEFIATRDGTRIAGLFRNRTLYIMDLAAAAPSLDVLPAGDVH